MRMIDADELLMLIDNHDNMVLEDVDSSCLKDVYKMAHVHIKDLIKMMPTVERKTGKWIIRDNPLIGCFRVSCSECGEDVTSNIPTIGFFPHCEPLWDYCPNCGADMRGEQDG